MGRAQRVGGLNSRQQQSAYQRNMQQGNNNNNNNSSNMRNSSSNESLSNRNSNNKWGSQYSQNKYRPRTALGRLEVRKGSGMRRSGLQSAGGSRSRNSNMRSNQRRPMSSGTGRRSMNNSWNLNGNSGGNSLSSSGSNGRIARGIASRRGRKKKKKSDADLSFNRFWKVNGKKAGGK